MRWLTFFVFMAITTAPGAMAEDTALKKYLTSVGKSFSAGSASTIAKAFPEQGKVSLKLSGIKAGDYRKPQAKSLLTTWFKTIKPGTCKLKTMKGLVGRFTFEYKIRKNGTTVKKTIQVSLRKAGESWLIVGILES